MFEMIRHMSNCHGEWTAVLMALPAVPFLVAWVRNKVKKNG